MEDFISFVGRNLPKDIMMPSLIVFSVVMVMVFVMGIRPWKKHLLWAFLLEYSLLILWSTVIERVGGDLPRYKLMPYWNWNEIVSFKDPLDIAEIILNVVLFIPIGALVSGIFRYWQVWRIALVGCFMSVAIEALQLWSRCGLCETNDVIHNTLGCAIGSVLICIFYRERH